MPKILVTGSSSGIGYKICESLLHIGYQVIGLCRNPVCFHHENYIPYTMDLSKINDQACKDLLKYVGPIDALVCNAGYGLFANLEEFSSLQIQNLMQVNFLSHVYLTKLYLPFFKKKEHSDIIFIGSEAALAGKKKGSIYCASKFAMRGFAQALREECSSTNIRVSIIQPGMTKTSFFEDLTFEPEIFLTPEQISATVSMVLRSEPTVVFDEIVLSPIKKKILFK